MFEVIVDGDLGSVACVAEGRLKGNHGLLRCTTHATEVGRGEVTRLAPKLLQGFEADQAPTDNVVEGGEDAGPPPGLSVRNEVPLGESIVQEVKDTQKDPGRGGR